MIPKSWLGSRVSVEIAEEDNKQPGGVPFGQLNDQWVKLKASMFPGDEIWGFSSPPDFWANLAGRCGYALVRNGEVVGVIVTMMN